MSLVLPEIPVPDTATLRSKTAAFVSETHNMRRIVSSAFAHQWELELTYPPMRREQAAPLIAFLARLNGQVNPFWALPPAYDMLVGFPTGTPIVSVYGENTGTKEIETRGWDSFIDIKAGNWVQFAGHTKLYMLGQDAPVDAAGEAILYIEPELRFPVTVGEVIMIGSPSIYGRLDQDSWEQVASPGNFFSGITLRIIEEPTWGEPFPDISVIETERIDIDNSGDDWLIDVGSDKALWR